MDQETKVIIGVDEMGLTMQRFSWPDYFVFVLMLVICSAIGYYWGFMKKQSTQDYLMGGRNMKVFPVSVSLVASFVSGVSLLGTPTEIYVYGVQYMYIFIGVTLMSLLLTNVYLPVFHELKLTSSYEYLERRFDKRMRLFGSIVFAIGMITWIPIVIYVPALAFNQVTGINIHVITPVVCIVCVFYTCVGGLKAVVWTDVIQTIMMFGAILVVVIKGTLDVGGISTVWQRNWDSGRIEGPNWDISPFTRQTIWSLVIGGCFYWLIINAVNQTMVQRYLSLPSIASAKKAVWCFLIGVITMLSFCCYCGLLIFATYHKCDPLTTKLAKAKDQLLPLYVMDVLGQFPGLPGLFVAGVFSAALSSLSTGLNSMAVVVLEDFYKPFAKKPLTDLQTGVLMKAVVILLGAICLGLVFFVEKLGTVLQLSMSLGAFTNGASLGVFTAGLLLPRVHPKGAFIGGLTGVFFMAWVCLGAQAAIGRGDLSFPEKPVTTEECQYSFNPPPHDKINLTLIKNDDDVFMLYRISFLWYTLLGSVITMGVAYVTSMLWQPIRLEDVDLTTIAPFLRKYYKIDSKLDEPAELQRLKVDHKEISGKNAESA